jgi:hypothetical protein
MSGALFILIPVLIRVSNFAHSPQSLAPCGVFGKELASAARYWKFCLPLSFSSQYLDLV